MPTRVRYTLACVSARQILPAPSKEAEAAKNRKMVNQRWSLKGDGAYTDIITAQLGQMLSKLGVILRDGGSATDFVMTGKVNDMSIHNDNHLARVSLKLEARNADGVIWNRLVQGKGVSFSRETEVVLLKKAVQDALENARESLEKFMQESVK